MRVLFVSDVYFPRVNGVSTSVATFRADLAATGVETELVAPQYGEPIADANESAVDAGIIRVPSGRVPRNPEGRRMRWRELQLALERLRDRHYDLVHIHTPFLAHYAGVRFARAAGIPVVETYHMFFEEYLHHYVPLLPRALGRRLARAVTRSQCNQVDALVAPSQPMRAMLETIGVRKPVQVIPTGLPAARFVRGDDARFRQQQRLPEGRPLLLYIGRWPIAMRPLRCLCLPRVLKLKGWCCSRRWLKALRLCRPPIWARRRSCRPGAAFVWRLRNLPHSRRR